jgi:23S rRNA (cytidine1920-2'-O)/16S rRNA (cytidine1409-2'-O)-methyltransferase
MARLRLDALVAARGLLRSRARARDAILRGTVAVDGLTVRDPGASVDERAAIVVDDPAAAWVSRSALKLVAGLDAFGVDPTGRHALDIGASTGGFTEVLLRRGAATVTAIDVGHGQLDAAIAADPRVVAIEGLNARALAAGHLARPPDLVVCDVSFISLTLALPPALALAAPRADVLALVKPQFEVGREKVGKGGLVDPAHGVAAAGRIRDWLDGREDFRVIGVVPSPVAGGDGNQEYLIGARRG